MPISAEPLRVLITGAAGQSARGPPLLDALAARALALIAEVGSP